jgi:hypothetical protein
LRRRKFNKKKFKGSKHNLGNTKRRRMLNMHGINSFNYELRNLLTKIPEESDRGPVFASIYSKASNIGIEEAEGFVNAKAEEGVIPKNLSIRLVELLYKYSRYR